MIRLCRRRHRSRLRNNNRRQSRRSHHHHPRKKVVVFFGRFDATLFFFCWTKGLCRKIYVCVCMKMCGFFLSSLFHWKKNAPGLMRHISCIDILSLIRTRRTNERTIMSKSNNNNKPLFSSLLFNIGQRDFDEKKDNDASSSSSSRHDSGGELAQIIRARSTRFLRHASPTVAAVEENVSVNCTGARGRADKDARSTRADGCRRETRGAEFGKSERGLCQRFLFGC